MGGASDSTAASPPRRLVTTTRVEKPKLSTPRTRRGTPPRFAGRAPARRRPRTGRSRSRPIRRARRRARTRRCRTDRARIVRASSSVKALACRSRIVPGRLRAGARQRKRSTRAARRRWIRRSPLPSMPRRSPALAAGARDRRGDQLEAVLRPGVEGRHQVAGEALDDRPASSASKPSSSSEVASGRVPGSPSPIQAAGACRREHQPVRHLVLRAGLRPAEAAAAEPAAVEKHGAGPVEGDRSSPGAWRRARRRARSCRKDRAARPASGSSGSSTTANSSRSKRRTHTSVPAPASPAIRQACAKASALAQRHQRIRRREAEGRRSRCAWRSRDIGAIGACAGPLTFLRPEVRVVVWMHGSSMRSGGQAERGQTPPVEGCQTREQSEARPAWSVSPAPARTMPLDEAPSPRAAAAELPHRRPALPAPARRVQEALASGAPVTVGCTQEAPLFAEVADSAARTGLVLSPTSARPPAGRTTAARRPKMAALSRRSRRAGAAGRPRGDESRRAWRSSTAATRWRSRRRAGSPTSSTSRCC